MAPSKLAVIIPTKDRPDDLARLLDSIASQDVRPIQVVRVDGGTRPLSADEMRRSGLKIALVRKMPASLTAQRNAGISALDREIDLVVFFDDDIVLEEGALRNMMRFWAEAKDDVGGAVFNNMSDSYKAPTFAEKIFLVNASTPGRIMASGFQSKLCSLKDTVRVDWLGGYAMVFRRSIFDLFSFDEWFAGYARYEDVDFSYRVGSRFTMFCVADAKVRHLSKLEAPSFSFRLGRMEVVNRIYFVQKYPNLSLLLCVWALFGLLLNNTIKGIARWDIRYARRAAGNMAGFIYCLTHIGRIAASGGAV